MIFRGVRRDAEVGVLEVWKLEEDKGFIYEFMIIELFDFGL